MRCVSRRCRGELCAQSLHGAGHGLAHQASRLSTESSVQPAVKLPARCRVASLVSCDAAHGGSHVEIGGMLRLIICYQRTEGLAHTALRDVVDGDILECESLLQRGSTDFLQRAAEAPG